MTIYKEIYDLIATTAENAGDREIGGILGADRAYDVCKAVVDQTQDINWYMYTPNIDHLNRIINRWQHWRFCGIFHSHLYQRTLSAADKDYIGDIMMAMPSDINCLYFPVYVVSENTLYGYKAKRVLNKVIILEEPVEII